MYSILWFAESPLGHLQTDTRCQGMLYISWLMSKNSIMSDAKCPDHEHSLFDLKIEYISSYTAAFK